MLNKYVDERPPEIPLITVSNHTSCLDDPMLWGKKPKRFHFELESLKYLYNILIQNKKTGQNKLSRIECVAPRL